MLGLVKGYIAEKRTADECIKSLESRNETLIRETERLRARVEVLEENHGDIMQREQDLVHQRQTLELGVDGARKSMYFVLFHAVIVSRCCHSCHRHLYSNAAAYIGRTA